MVLTTALLTAGCGAPKSSDEAVVAPTGDTLPDTVAAGSVAIVADPVLTAAFTENKARLAVDNAGLKVGMTFAPGLAAAASNADVIAGYRDALAPLVSGGLVEKPTPFARDDVEAVISPGNPKQLTQASDLTRPGLRLVVLPAGTPSGDAARVVLSTLGVATAPTTMEAAAAISAVNAGTVDAVLLYATDGAANRADLVLSIPEAQNIPRVYEAAIVKRSAQAAAARAFVEQLISGVGSQALQGAGFRLP